MRRNFLLVFICILSISNLQAELQKHRTGQFSAVFEKRCSLSSADSIAERMREPIDPDAANNGYDIANETFEVYVPQDYRPQSPYGLLVWIHAGDKGGIPENWQPLMDKHKLIWIGANNSGNKQSLRARRIPLALDAAFNMEKLYNIDPNRMYLSGLSGGGRTASTMAFHYSDIFDGAIFIIGANYWEKMTVPGKRKYTWRAGSKKPRQKYLFRAKKHGRYVLLTGDYDGNRDQMYAYYMKGYRKHLDNVLYIQVPGMGHKKPPAEWFEKAIVFLDNPTHTPEKTN